MSSLVDGIQIAYGFAQAPIAGIVEILGIVLSAWYAHARWTRRVKGAQNKLKEIDAGKRCLQCETTATHVADGRVTCKWCGYATTLTSLSNAKASVQDVEKMMYRDD